MAPTLQFEERSILSNESNRPTVASVLQLIFQLECSRVNHAFDGRIRRELHEAATTLIPAVSCTGRVSFDKLLSCKQ